ncbi:MAG: hypothetical protein WC343_14480 [Bacilli bacterium]|jgi:hypothetical protein
MKAIIRVKHSGTIADIQDRQDLILVDLSQDVDAIKQHFGNRKSLKQFDGFFIKVDNGDYEEVYGFSGNIPYLTKDIYKITLELKQCLTLVHHIK